MPAEVDDDIKGKIVTMRALDYDKQEIASQLDISRRTVTRHLDEIRSEAESDQTDEAAVVLEKVLAGAVGASVGVGIGLGLTAFLKALKNANENDDQQTGVKKELEELDDMKFSE